MGVSVEDEVGAVLGDRSRESLAAEVRVDAERLSLERVDDRRVVKEDDPDVAVHDRLQTAGDGLDLVARLGIDPPQQRLPEIRQRRAGKAADEALRADDAELELFHLAGRALAFEETNAGAAEHLLELVRPLRVVVVVAENGEDRNVEKPARGGEHLRLLRLATRRQVAGEEHDVGLPLELRESALDALGADVRGVNVGSCCDPYHGVPCCAIGQSGNDPPVPEATFEEMLDAMKVAAGALQQSEIPFVLGGGLAVWARGGPKSEHDVDFMIRPQDADAALDAMDEAGLRTERPPEGWLYKAWHENGALIDLIFAPSGGPITDETIDRAPLLEVNSLRVHVFTLEDVMSTKLLALTEQEPDYTQVLSYARALREQIHWDEVRARSEASPFARAFFTLVEGLGIVGPAESEEKARPG
jgi:Nucleotidyl transferase of unknown function (DUF2204)